MGVEVSAQSVFEDVSARIQNFQGTNFVKNNPGIRDLDFAYSRVIQFLLDRPVMLVNDIYHKDEMIEFLLDEVDEAIVARDQETEFDFFKELGDVGFFGLIVGALFWDEMVEEEQGKVIGALSWASTASQESGLDFSNAIQYVSDVKNVTNYRSELYGLIKDEDINSVITRAPEIRLLHKALREELNGEWAGANNLIQVLAHHWLSTLTREYPDTIMNIEKLFALTGFDLLVELERGEYAT